MTNDRRCQVASCDRAVYARDLCLAHYNRLHRLGDVMEAKPVQWHGDQKVCAVPDCDRALRAKGYCGSHYSRFRYGDALRPEEPIRRWVRR